MHLFGLPELLCSLTKGSTIHRLKQTNVFQNQEHKLTCPSSFHQLSTVDLLSVTKFVFYSHGQVQVGEAVLVSLGVDYFG